MFSQARMSASDFLLAPEVQKLLKVVFAAPTHRFSAAELAKNAKLSIDDVERTQEHLIQSGILTRHASEADGPGTVEANRSFIFYNELRSIALKSFAAAEPLRAMLRKFNASVLQAFVLGEGQDGTIELLVVHGQQVPDEKAMAAACQKVSATLGRHLQVHVISSKRHATLTLRDHLGRQLATPTAFEIIAVGETKAKRGAEQRGFLQSAKEKLVAFTR